MRRGDNNEDKDHFVLIMVICLMSFAFLLLMLYINIYGGVAATSPEIHFIPNEIRSLPDYENATEEDLAYCNVDSDCVVVNSECCGCDVVSINIPIEDLLVSINKNFTEQWYEELQEECQGIACILGMSPEQVERCNLYISKCINNQCVLSSRTDS